MTRQTFDKTRQEALSPADALQLLKDGNERFVTGQCAARDLTCQVTETSQGQAPFAVVLGCIDSRVSHELVFDQGIGDLFSVRIAGNFVNDDILGSMEFACKLAGAKLVVVLGHSRCGAVMGACDGAELGHLTGMLGKLRPAVDAVASDGHPVPHSSENAEFVQAVAQENVRRTAENIAKQSDVLAQLRDEGAIDIVGGMYDIATGRVEFS